MTMSDISKDGSDEIYYCFEKDVCKLMFQIMGL